MSDVDAVAARAPLAPPPADTNRTSTTSDPATPPATAPAEPPELTTYTASEDDERIAGLKLVADTIAQQRQKASRVLITHPLNMAVYVGVCSVIARYVYTSQHGSWPMVLTTLAGVTMAFLVAVRGLTQRYIDAAEAVRLDFIDGRDVVVTKFGDEIIAAVVWGWEGAEGAEGGAGGKTPRGGGKRAARESRTALVWGWAVRLRFRGKGVGTALLEQAVDQIKAKGGEAAEVPPGHANSRRILPSFYNGPFDRSDARARKTLQKIWDARPAVTATTRRKR